MSPLRRIFVLVLSVGLVAAVPPASDDTRAVATADVEAVPRLAARVPATTAEGTGLIRLMAGAFDPTRSLAPVPGSIPLVDPATLGRDAATYWLAQVAGDALVEARTAIDDAGAVVEGVVPDTTYVIRATAEQAAAVAGSDAVRAVVLYQPGWKVPVALGEYEALLDVAGPQRYHVHLWDSAPDAATAGAAVGAIDGARVLEATDRVLTVGATREQVPAIAAVSDVAWVELEPTVVPLNAQARWVNDTAVRDLPNVLTDQRLDGSGQTAGVADTGVNYVPDRNGNAHVSFRHCSGGTVHEPTGCREADYVQAQPGTSEDAMNETVATGERHRKMAAYFDLGATGPNPSDLSAHGTHVAGSVTGDHGAYGTWDGEDGMAPAARLVHQNIGSPGGGLASPSVPYRLWQQAYRPRDPASVESRPAAPITYAQATAAYVPDEDARTHNNSYGLIVPSVSLGSAEDADRFVWEHEDMLIVSSAGNSGPVPYSIGAPSLGKNVVSSAASANGRQPMASIDSIASFSSHGPTGDGRLGVDLATPGQTVISAKGGTDDEFHYLQGTSMSGPVLTGFATLVRQYFWDGYGPGTGAAGATASGFAAGSPADARRHNPSAALVRAALVNGATRMEGWYSGDDGSQREMDGQYPSAGQGFGLVNLTDSLFFDDDQGRSTRNAWFTDVWRADGAAFGIGTGGIRDYEIDVAPGEPLSVTLTYTDAPSEPGLGTPYRVNDLDLVVEAPDGTLYSGNNFNTRAQPKAEQAATLPGVAPDPNNPVERVLIPAPAAGTWTVRVIGTEVALGPQGFALAAAGLVDEADGTPTFVAGDPLQTDAPGSPTVAGVTVETVDHDIARVTWTTSEPTTGAVELRGTAATRTFPDVYNHDGPSRGNDGDPGYDGLEEGPVETSEDYANKPVVTTDHEVLVTGLEAGERYDLVVRSTDLGGNTTSAPSRSYTATDAIFGAQAFDMAQLIEAPTDAVASFDPILGIGDGAFGLGTQLYAGEANEGLLGAFMFRLPEDVDPSRITGAAVELTSMHDLTNHYESDIITYVDLLPEVYEEDWQANNYETIHNAPSVARTLPETGYRRGGQKTYPFSFTCTDLDQLKGSLSTVQEGERRAAFRFDAETDIPGLFSHEFGFNRRSRGADLRPRLVLSLDGRDPSGCDASAPAPTIVDLGIQEALAGETDDDGNDVTRAVTVSWQTDVPSDSTVLFREQGSTAEPTAVNHPSLTTTHGVTVLGLDPAKTYEFAVASANCAGRVTVDDNGDQGYLLYPPEFPSVEDLDPDQFTTFFFHGSPTDEAEKTAQRPSATFSTEPPDGEPGFQHTTALANTSFVENFLAAYWTGPVDGPFELNGPLVFEWYWGGEVPRETAVDIVVFADPDRSQGASRVQPERIVASGTVPVTVTTGPVPSEMSVGTIPVRDGAVTVQNELVIQVTGGGLEDDDLVVHYDSAETPSRFRVPTVQIAQPPAEIPDAGPVPPDPSDGFAAAPPQQLGTPTDPARAAGTARCGTVTRATDAPDGSSGSGGSGGTGGGGSGGSNTGQPTGPADDGGRAEERGRGPDSACDPRRVPATPFEDTSGSVHEASIRCIAWYQITRGVGDPDGDGREEYAPLWRVNRAQMASFVARLAIEAGIDLDEDAPDAFSDDDGLVHEPAINALAAVGLVEGVDDERFEPSVKVTRAQMASFIARLHAAATGTRLEPQRDHFGDDDGTHHERNINILADLGVVRGVGDTDGDGRSDYRPAAAVTRAQMASFIARDLDLLAAAGRARPGGAEVFLGTTRAAPGEEVTGRVSSHKSIRALRADGCGIDDARLSVADDGTFTLRIPEDQEQGSCELALAVTSQREFQPGDGQDVVYLFSMTIEAP